MSTAHGATTVEIVGGDMLDWSDQEAGRPVAGGIVLEQLLRQAVPDAEHALVVGPHDWALVDCVVSRARTTTLVLRSHPDAVAARERYLDAEVRIVCGDIASVYSTTPADLVVALDGLERLVSVERERPDWAGIHARLDGLLSPGASMLLMVENPVSIGELGAVPVAESTDDDSAWWTLDTFDRSRPHGARAIEERLPGSVVFSAHPDPRRPTLLAPCAAGPDVVVPEPLVVAHNARSDSRIDTRLAMAKALAAHGAEDLASGWLVVRSPRMSTGDAGLVADGFGQVVEEVRRNGASFERRVVHGPTVHTLGDWVYTASSPAALAPVDSLLETELLRACARRDLAAVRRLSSTFVDHLRGLDEEGLATWAAGSFDNVVLTHGDRFEMIDASWRMSRPAQAEELAVELLDDFAGRLTALGWRHPWPVATGRDEIAVLLAAAASVRLDVDEIRAHRERREVADRHRSRVRHQPLVVPPDAHELLLQENRGLHSQVAWFKKALRQRDTLVRELRAKPGQQKPKDVRQLRELQHELVQIKQSRAFRTGKALAKPSALVRRLVRRTR